MHEVHGSNPGVMHILSKYFVRAYTRIYRHMTVPSYDGIYFHIPSYDGIHLYILSIRVGIPGIYKDDRVYDGSFAVL